MNTVNVLAVDGFSVDAESSSPGGHFSGSGFSVACVLVVLIVLTDVNHRQFPEGSHVHAFVKQSLPERTLAKEADCYLIGTAHLRRHRRPGGDSRAAADDSVGSEIPGVLIGNMHGTTFPAAISRFLAEKLGEHLIYRRALSKTMSMTAVGTGYIVIAPQRFADTYGNRLLSDVEMSEPGHLGAKIELIDLFFEKPDLEHLAVKMQSLVAVKRRR